MLGRLLPETALRRRVVKSASGGKEEKKKIEKKSANHKALTHLLTPKLNTYLFWFGKNMKQSLSLLLPNFCNDNSNLSVYVAQYLKPKIRISAKN